MNKQVLFAFSAVLSVYLLPIVVLGDSVNETNSDSRQDMRSSGYDNAIDFAYDFLNEYYHAKDLHEDYSFSDFVDNPYLMEYIDNKLIASEYELIAYDVDDKKDYELTVDCVDQQLDSGTIYLRIKVIATFRYKGSSGQSECGEQNWVAIQCDDMGKYVVSVE